MTASETPPSDPSVLGVDPVEPVEPTVAPIVPAPVQPEGVSITQDEYDSLFEKASGYDTIVQDQQLQGVIYKHLHDRTSGKVVDDSAQTLPNPDPTANPLEARMVKIEQVLQQGAQAFQQLQAENQRLNQEVGTLRTNEFGKANPSFDAHQAAVAKVCQNNPGLTLEDALTLVEAKALKAGNGTVAGGISATPTTEGGGAGGIPSSSGDLTADRIAELAQQINDPKASQSLDVHLDAIGKAFGVN